MYLSIDPLLNFQRLVEQDVSVVQFALGDQYSTKHGERGRGLGMFLAVKGLNNIQPLTVVFFGFRIMARFRLDGAEINQVVSNMRMAFPVKLAINRQCATVQGI